MNGVNREGGLGVSLSQIEVDMTRKLFAVLAATLVLFATPLAGPAVAAEAGNTTDETAGNDIEEMPDNDTAGNDSDGISMPFGLQVSSFVDSAKDNETGPLGPLVASFVTANNPGNAPDHAGPPAWLFGGNDETESGTEDNETTDRGPPEDVGPDDNERGPPVGAGPSDNSTQGPPADAGPDRNTTQGPPDDRGPDNDDSDTEEDDSDTDEEDDETEEAGETEEDDETREDDEAEEIDEDDEETEEGDETDERRGPPENAGPPTSAGPP